jgi:hypothetical protein
LTDKQKKVRETLEFATYCNKCEFTDWCDKKNKPMKLQSVIEANNLCNELEDSKSIILDDLPDKIYQLAKIAQRTLINLSKDK